MSGTDGETDRKSAYDIWGRTINTTDGNGSTTSYHRDKWGRVTAVFLPNGGTEHYRYDYAGNVISATDALGNETRFTYSKENRVESIRKADGAVRYFGYDTEGRCTYRLDENHNLIRTLYNMDGNPVLMTGSRNVSPGDILQDKPQPKEPDIRSVYTYDERGFLTSASEGGTVYHYTRDSEGRILTKSAWGKTLYEASYGADGEPSDIVAQGVKTEYAYDDAGRLKSLVSDNGLSVQYSYDRNGMQTQMVYGNGLITSYTYDSRSRLTGMQSGYKDHPPVFSASYVYDANGNRTGKRENIIHRDRRQETLDIKYGYDSMNRLVTENSGDREVSYSYDLSGNRITRNINGIEERYLYNSRNQLTELTGDNKSIRYTYDPAGNLVEEQTESSKKIYAYDVYNRNTEITDKEFTQKNHYDAEGYRYSLEENDRVTNFVYHDGIMLAELDKDKNQTKSYVLGNEYAGQNLVNSLNSGLDEKEPASYYITDEQGSIRYILSKNGEVQNYYSYSAFGETSISEESISNRLRYNAQTEDNLTGLYYLRARYYNPKIGRFTQEDVIYNDGLNLYAYCDSNPVMYCDPSGFEGEDICGPLYDKLKKAYENNSSWNANPDKFRVVQGEELTKKREEYNTMVKKGELPAGHHIHGLAEGGSNTIDNIRITGERFINREDLPAAAVEYYDKYYATKSTPHPQRIAIYEENGKVSFGKNQNHTDVTNMQNELHRWQRKEGIRTETSAKTKSAACKKKRG